MSKNAWRFYYILLAIVGLIYLFPVLWMVSSSFKYRVDLFSIPPVWIPSDWTLTNFFEIDSIHPFGRYLRNSATAAGLSTLLTLLIGVPAAYAFARRGGTFFSALFLGFLSIRMVPPVVLIIPMYQSLGYLRLIDTITGLTLVYTALQTPLVIWLLKGAFEEIPRELDEAAQVDGCSRFGALVRVIMPVSRSALVGAGMFAFLTSWSEYLFALVLTSSPAAVTAPVGIAGLVTQHEIRWGVMTAEGTIFLIPVVIGVFFVQKYLIAGLTAGAVKG